MFKRERSNNYSLVIYCWLLNVFVEVNKSLLILKIDFNIAAFTDNDLVDIVEFIVNKLMWWTFIDNFTTIWLYHTYFLLLIFYLLIDSFCLKNHGQLWEKEPLWKTIFLF